MRTELYGQRIGSLMHAWISVIKNFIFLRYGLFEETKIQLNTIDFPIVEGLGLLRNQEGNFAKDGIVVGTVRMGYGHHR
ncbi:MAG: hypothetical protein N3A69_14760, partial [Leptospiraceae bacterium]|nr:hypothetical protein [Leptospiraceae bacterium]